LVQHPREELNVRALLLAASLLCSSCVTFSFDRDLRYVPLPEDAIDSVEPGEADLVQCLERFGAPLYVWEYKGSGVALGYGWHKEKTWNVTVSVPVAHGLSASASYTDDAAKLRGIVLLFGPDLKLEMVRRGFLQSLREEIQARRPAPVDEEDDAEPRSAACRGEDRSCDLGP
jgi:hypothetical protein